MVEDAYMSATHLTRGIHAAGFNSLVGILACATTVRAFSA
jgi:hypothetical protein